MSELWATVRESLAGSHREYTEGPIGRAVLLLAIPMVLELLLESVFAVVDVFFVAKLGADAVATVGLTESIETLVYSVAMGLSMGATATVARRIGERDADGAAVAAVQALALALIIALPLGLGGWLMARPLLALMGATPGVLANSTYAAIVFGFNGVIVTLFLINAVFRGAGDAAIAMRVLWIANAINLCLDPCLIFGLGPFPELGVTGAAVATTTGRTIGVVVQIVALSRGVGRIRIRREHLRIDPQIMMNMLRLSGTAVFQILVSTTSYIGVMRILATFGSAALAGSTIAIRIVIFVLLPSWGLSNAAATLVGQNLGAGKPDRAERSVWLAGFYNMIFLAFVGAVFVIGAPWIVRGFTDHPDVARSGVACLRIVSSCFLFYAYGMVLTQAFNGAGDTWTPTWINFFVYWLWEIPLAIALAHWLELGPRGVYIAICTAEALLAVIAVVLFRRGKWKTVKI
jgi:putative MATE family efflux protein